MLCREIARRRGLGLLGLCLLGAAYAVFEEALVDRFWFHPRPAADGGLGTYSEVRPTNVVLATNLTVFHVAVSVVSTVVLWVRLPARTSLWTSDAPTRPRRRGVAPVAFVAAAANFLLMSLSDVAVPWPAGST